MSTLAESLALDSSRSAAVFGCVVFGALSGGHIYLCIRHKTWFFQFTSWGSLLELASLLVLASAVNNPGSREEKAVLIVFLLLQLAGPALIAISTYMTFDRLVWYMVPAEQRTGRNLWISRWQIATTTVIIELFCFILTFTGGVIYALDLKGYEQPTAVTGYGMMISGLALQLAGRIYLVASSLRTAHTSSLGAADSKTGCWDAGTVFNVLAIAGLSLTFRALYTVIMVGRKAKQHEWMLYMFNALPLAVVLGAFAIVHPGQVLPDSFTRFRLKVKNDAMMREAGLRRGMNAIDRGLHGEPTVVAEEQADELQRRMPGLSGGEIKANEVKAPAPPPLVGHRVVAETAQQHSTWV